MIENLKVKVRNYINSVMLPFFIDYIFYCSSKQFIKINVICIITATLIFICNQN